MPYDWTLYLRSPYLPRGAHAFGVQAAWREPLIYKGEWIFNKSMGGVPIDPAEAPSRFRVGIPAARLPDFFGLAEGGYCVSDLVRDKIEELEPGVHQFLPAAITAKGGEVPQQRYSLFHICNRVDAIDPEKSVLSYDEGLKTFDRSSRGLPPDATPRMVLRKEAVAGMCAWVDRRWKYGYFMSDALAEFLIEAHRRPFIGPKGTFLGGRKRTKLVYWEVFTE